MPGFVKTGRYFWHRRWNCDRKGEYKGGAGRSSFEKSGKVAPGTFGPGEEYSEFIDLNVWERVVTKGVANVPWPGNPTPRVAEVRSRNA